jgi:hypothetical protein
LNDLSSSSSSSSALDDIDIEFPNNYSSKVNNNDENNEPWNRNHNPTGATDIQLTRGLPAKSQVQEALDNQTSDSGMDPVDDDPDDEENEIFFGTTNAKSQVEIRQKYRRLVIQEDDNDDDLHESD